MAQGSQTLTTYYAKRIIGDAAASGAAAALLQTGSGVTANTWILNRTNRENNPYGIYYYYDNTTSGTADKIQFIGGSTSSVRAEIELDNGNTDIKGTLNAVGATTLGSTLAVAGNTTISGTFNVYDDTILHDTLNVIGDTTLSSDLNVYGNSSLSGTLTAGGAATLGSTLDVAGNTTLSGTLNTYGATTLSSTLDVIGNTTLSGDLDTYGNTTLSGTLNVYAATTLSSTLEIGGNTTFSGHLYLTGTTSTGKDNTTQILFTNSNKSTEYVAITSYTGGSLLINQSSSNSTGQIGLTPNGKSYFNSTISATSTSTGALVVSGGVGIGGKLYVGNDTHLDGDLHMAASKGIYMMRNDNNDYEIIHNYANGNIVINSAGDELSLGYKFTKAIKMFYTPNTTRTEYFTINSNGAKAITRFGVNGQSTSYTLYVDGTTNITGVTTLTSTTSATSSSTGALVVSGGTGIGGALYVGGAGTFSSSLSADTITITNTSAASHLTFSRNGANYIVIPDNSSAGLYIGKGTSAANSFVTISATKLEILNTTSATSTDTGALVVGGGAGIDGALYTGGAGSIGGTLTVKGTSISIQTGGSRYKHIYIKNSAGNTAGDIYYDSGNATNISSGRFAFYEYSPNATANTTNNGNYERYLLPTVKTNLADSVDYSIITTKNLTSITSVGTIASGTWNGTEIGTAYGGTGNTSFTASRLIYTSAATTLSTGSNLITDGTYLALNTTSIDGSHGLYIREGGKNAGRLHVVTSGATANTEGWLQFSLGNETKSSAANNWSGRLRLCNKNGAYSDIEGAYGSLGGSNKNYISMTYVKATNFYGDLVGKYMSVASGGVSSSGEAIGSTSLANVQIRYGSQSSVPHKQPTTIYFNPAFPGGCYKVMCITDSSNFGSHSTISVTGVTKAKFAVYQCNSGNAAMNIHWIAFGY